MLTKLIKRFRVFNKEIEYIYFPPLQEFIQILDNDYGQISNTDIYNFDTFFNRHEKLFSLRAGLLLPGRKFKLLTSKCSLIFYE